MRKRRILSLLLAVAVTATMLIAVPLTASAAEPAVWDKNQYPDILESDSNTPNGGIEDPEPVTVDDLTVDLLPSSSTDSTTQNVTHWYYNTNYQGIYSAQNPQNFAVTGNTDSSDLTTATKATRVPNGGTVVKISVAVKGTVSASLRTATNNKAKPNWVVAFPAGSSGDTDGDIVKCVVATVADNTLDFEAEPGKDYYILTNGSKMTYKSITFTPGSGSVEPGPGGQTEKVTAEVYSEPFKSTNKNYVDWLFHQDQIDIDGTTNINSESFRTINIEGGGLTPEPELVYSGTQDAYGYSKGTGLPTFDLPHSTHEQHDSTKVFVFKTGKSDSFTTKNVLPTNDKFVSYDLIIAYNVNEDTSADTAITVKDYDSGSGIEGQELAVYTDTTGGNARGTDPDEIIFKNITSKDVKITWSKQIDIFDISIDYHKAAAPEDVTLDRGEKDYVSGIYYKDDDDNNEARGVIRFFQDYSNDAEVDGYGFVFINSESEVIDTNIKKGRIVQSASDGPLDGKSGFYGDVYNILAEHYGDPVIAVPYVSVDGHIIFAEESITGTVDNQDNKVKNEWEWVD